jgi:hypothetical protein
MTTLKPTGPSVPGEHPTEVNKVVEPLSLTERAVFGPEAVRDSETGRVFECGSGALSHDEQRQLFRREAAIAKRKAEIEQEALRQAEAAAAVEQKPALRLVGKA